MKSSQCLLRLAAILCIAAIGIALYLQIAQNRPPCPLCIVQRYLLLVIAIIGMLFSFLPRTARKIGAGFALLLGLSGIGTTGWQLWVQAHPSVSCGIDPLVMMLNNLVGAKQFPLLFQATGLCTMPRAPILNLSLPAWTLLGFIIVSVILAAALSRKK